MKKTLLLILLTFIILCDSFSQTIKVTTWNIYMLPNIFNTFQKERAELIGDYILKNNSDVFILQEAFNGDAIKIIYNKIKSIYKYDVRPFKENFFSLRINNGLWILSKYPITDHEFHKFNIGSGFDYFAQKGILFADINLFGKIIQVFNTHLNSGDCQPTRDVQYDEMKEFIDKFKNNNIQIIAGDFNTKKSEKTNYFKMLRSIELNDYDSNELTYNSNENDMVDEYIVDVLDYIFIRNTDDNQKRLVEKPKTTFSTNRSDLSDHYPVVLKINLDDNKFLTKK